MTENSCSSPSLERPPSDLVIEGPRPSSPMIEIVSLPPPALAPGAAHQPSSATVFVWRLFNRSGRYWIKGAKCVRSRLLHETRDSRFRKSLRRYDPLCCSVSCFSCGNGRREREWQRRNPSPIPTPPPPTNYVVVGLLNSETGGVREQLETVPDRDGLFKAIRQATKDLRPFYIRFFSLKAIGGFGLYKCEQFGDYHVAVDLDDQSSATLHELFRAYSSNTLDGGDRWKEWVHKYLNASSKSPQDGKYALRLILRWSVVKLVIYTTIPVILSLVVGFWLMFGAAQNLNDSYTDVVQTAWTVSSYIITAAGVIIALLGAVTVLGDRP